MSRSKKTEFVAVTYVSAGTNPEDISKAREEFLTLTRQTHQEERKFLDEHPQAHIQNYASFTGMQVSLFDGKDKAAMLKEMAMKAKKNANDNKEEVQADTDNSPGPCPLF